MPSVLEDPSSFIPSIADRPAEILAKEVKLKDGTTATLVPIFSSHQVPEPLMKVVNKLLNDEIEGGDSYPMTDPMSVEKFSTYWFGNFGVIMLLGNSADVDQLLKSGADESTYQSQLLGTYYIKPNYPGRCSHVCNAGFITNTAQRNKGSAKLMAQSYIEWAPKLGYTYSVFNLVFATNVHSLRIWDSLGFQRIGIVKGCARLRSYPNQLIDAIQIGRELGPNAQQYSDDQK